MSGTRNIDPNTLQLLAAPARNSVHSEPGLRYNNTYQNPTFLLATLPAAAAISAGADGRGFFFKFRLPSYATINYSPSILWFIGSNNTGTGASSIVCLLDSNGALRFRIYGTNATDYRETTLAGFFTAFGINRDVICQFGADDTGRDLRINGVDVSASLTTDTTVNTNGTAPANWGTAITSTYWGWGNSSQDGVFKKFWPCNFRPSLIQAQDSYFIGGGVPHYLRWGNITDGINGTTNNGGFETAGAASTNGNLWANWGGSTGVANFAFADETGITHAGGHAARLTYTGGATPGWNLDGSNVANGVLHIGSRLFEASFWGYLVSGITNPVSVKCADNNLVIVPSAFSGTGSWQQFKFQTLYTPTQTFSFTRNTNLTGAYDVILDDVRVRALGALFFLSPSDSGDGCGYQLHDVGPNNADAVVPVATTWSEWTWSHPTDRGYVRGTLTWAASQTSQSLIGQRCFPVGAVVDDIVIKASAGSSGTGIVVNTTSTSGRWAAAQTFTTAKKVLVLANRTPAGNADNDHDLKVVPDNANYTGSIAVSAKFKITEGAAA